MGKKERILLLIVAVVLLSFGGRIMADRFFADARTEAGPSMDHDTEKNIPFRQGAPVVKTKDPTILVTILGEVNTPGSFRANRGVSIRDLIDVAGGLTPYADTNSIDLERIVEENEAFYIFPQ